MPLPTELWRLLRESSRFSDEREARPPMTDSGMVLTRVRCNDDDDDVRACL